MGSDILVRELSGRVCVVDELAHSGGEGRAFTRESSYRVKLAAPATERIAEEGSTAFDPVALGQVGGFRDSLACGDCSANLRDASVS